jgi:hypothetical protein
MPILADVGGWQVASASRIVFDDATGDPVLTFTPGPDGAWVATGPEGETYELAAPERQRLAQAGAAPASTPRPAADGIRSAPPAPGGVHASVKPEGEAMAAAAVHVGTDAPVVPFNGRPNDLAGRYFIMREGTKDVGCMLTFDEKARGPRGSHKAQLAPGCRDQGIVIFDPVGWQLQRNGKLALIARKGHQVHFDWHSDSSWWKEPKEGGKPLGFRKM